MNAPGQLFAAGQFALFVHVPVKANAIGYVLSKSTHGTSQFGFHAVRRHTYKTWCPFSGCASSVKSAAFCVVPQCELDRTAVHAGAQAVGSIEPVEPGDASVELALDRAGAARVGVALVQKHGIAGAAAVGHLVAKGRSAC